MQIARSKLFQKKMTPFGDINKDIKKHFEVVDNSEIKEKGNNNKDISENTKRTVVGHSSDTIKEIKNIYFILFNKYKSDDSKNFSDYMKSCSSVRKDEMFDRLPKEYQMKLISNL